MDRTTYPFPLAVNSSHHSHYHRFLLGVDASVLAPFPKPYCLGEMAPQLGRLAGALSLAGWRKLFNGSLPWRPGFAPEHYTVAAVPPHCPLPPEYGRPARRFGAYDFVQMADPSVSALALVAGDRRVLERFVSLSDDFCRRIEPAASLRSAAQGRPRATGRMLAGQFAEPNNRWLMPFLHVHARVLNFTSTREEPATLGCIDAQALGRAGQKAKEDWVGRQAAFLQELGYKAQVRGDMAPVLCVDGVSERLVATMEAPRIAVLRILEKTILGERPPSADRLGSELPLPVIAAMAEQLETLIVRSLSYFRPVKIGIPSEGPWRAAVREHALHHCPGDLERVDAAALRAKASRYDSSLFCVPALDASHGHVPDGDSLDAAQQLPTDAELRTRDMTGAVEHPRSRWLADEFASTLDEVNERIVRTGAKDPLVSLRRVLAPIDQLVTGAEPEQLRQMSAILNVDLERREPRQAGAETQERRLQRPQRGRLASLDELFAEAVAPRLACEQEIGGRSL